METPRKWRRFTISRKYSGAAEHRLESNLGSLERYYDKWAELYMDLRDSLPSIQAYNTVTNLHLETDNNDRLHVHVTENVNEIIAHPPNDALACLRHPVFVENEVTMVAQLSSFVYQVRVDRLRDLVVKKDIPGPEDVDSFLYEVMALHSLQGIPGFVEIRGVIVNDTETMNTKGILTSFPERGSLLNVLADIKASSRSSCTGPGTFWPDRERWARQIAQALSELHAEGYMRGHLTLENIGIDADNNAKIVGITSYSRTPGSWPPEIAVEEAPVSQITTKGGEKSNQYELGMILWAIAALDNKPEMRLRPLPPLSDEIPAYYRDIVSSCLATKPRARPEAAEILDRFPTNLDENAPLVIA